MIEIYTDGSCIGNPGPGGWGVLVLEKKLKHILKGGAKDTTNNRMEMSAIIAALKWIHEKKKTKEKIKICSDSNLIVQTLTSGWKRKANLDLWEKIDRGVQDLNITWQWVKAHHTNELNNEVDQVAFKEAKKSQKR